MSTHLESGSVAHTVSDQATSLGDIIELGLAPGGTWQQNNLTAITGAPQTATAPFAYVAPDKSGRVVYQDSSGGITELWLAPGGTWQYDSLTALTGAPLPASAPFAYVTPDNVTRVIYNTNSGGGSIIELSLPPGGTWQQNNLTAIAGADLPLGSAPAGSAPFAYVTPDGTARVLYRGPIYAQTDPAGLSSYIIELSLAPGGTWQQADLTDTTRGAPYPSSAPFGYVGPDGLARVVYTALNALNADVPANGDVIELRLDPDGWVYSDLTVSVNPPAPTPASALFAYVGADDLARVAYTGSSGDIIELRLDGDGWVQSDLTVSVNSPPAPPAASAPFAYVTPDKVARVYYSSSPS